jgi:hypothetical protein
MKFKEEKKLIKWRCLNIEGKHLKHISNYTEKKYNQITKGRIK